MAEEAAAAEAEAEEAAVAGRAPGEAERIGGTFLPTERSLALLPKSLRVLGSPGPTAGAVAGAPVAEADGCPAQAPPTSASPPTRSTVAIAQACSSDRTKGVVRFTCASSLVAEPCPCEANTRFNLCQRRMASGVVSKALRRACVQSGSRRFLHMMLMWSTSCPPKICLIVAPPQIGSKSNTLGYCMVKTRSIPYFTVNNSTGNKRPTPSGESRCGEVTEDQSPWMVTSSDCREVSGKRCAAGCKVPSTAQYRRCETRPISRTTSIEVTSSRMLAISLGSSRDVSNSTGRRFAE